MLMRRVRAAVASILLAVMPMAAIAQELPCEGECEGGGSGPYCRNSLERFGALIWIASIHYPGPPPFTVTCWKVEKYMHVLCYDENNQLISDFPYLDYTEPSCTTSI
jgi:hypothetical protein